MESPYRDYFAIHGANFFNDFSSVKAVKSILYSLKRIQYLGLSRFREKECGIPVEKIVQGSAIKEMRKEKWDRECSGKEWKNMR